MEERTAASAQDQTFEAPRAEIRTEPQIRTESQRLRAFLKPPNLPQIELFEFTDANFGEEVVNATVPVIIDFWSDTCGPCKLMHPVVRRLAGA
ncbi:MAG: thioredoxin family protein, partial [Planctomycetota bacterium]